MPTFVQTHTEPASPYTRNSTGIPPFTLRLTNTSTLFHTCFPTAPCSYFSLHFSFSQLSHLSTLQPEHTHTPCAHTEMFKHTYTVSPNHPIQYTYTHADRATPTHLHTPLTFAHTHPVHTNVPSYSLGSHWPCWVCPAVPLLAQGLLQEDCDCLTLSCWSITSCPLLTSRYQGF